MRSYTATLESSEDCILPRNAPKLSRQKHSKIQNHSVQIHGLDTEALPWYVELQPLKNKTKEVVATSIIVALNGVLAALLSPEDVRDELPTVVHVLTGDSINTNEAACRIVLHYFREISSFRRCMTYRLIMWRCAAHKAALVTVTAICGRQMVNPVDGNELCASVSRFFRHLLPDYTEEFAALLRQWVIANTSGISLIQGPIPSAEARVDRGLLQLYGLEVIPNTVRSLLNIDICQLLHQEPQPKSLETFRGLIFTLLYRLLLQPEDKPVISRFWLFGFCANKLLLCQLLKIPAQIFRTQTIHMQEENAKRAVAFRSWYDDEVQQRDLRRACLCLRLTGLATSLTAKRSGTTKASLDEVPTLVKLAKGVVQQRTLAELLDIADWLHADTLVDQTSCFASLFVTEIHILLRFSEYQEFPAKLCLLSRRFNPDTFMLEIEHFLDVPEALGVMRNANAFPRARGQLRHQPKMKANKRREIVHPGDPNKLRGYIRDNEPALKAEAAGLRKVARTCLQELAHSLPVTNEEWGAWLQKEEKKFRNGMKMYPSQRMSQCCRRLEPLPGLGECPRIRPYQPALPPWALKVKSAKSGPFFLLKGCAARAVVVAAGVGSLCWAFVLQKLEDDPTVFVASLPTCFDKCKDIVSLAKDLRIWQGPGQEDPEVFSLQVAFSKCEDRCVSFQVLGADLVPAPSRSAPAEDEVAGDIDLDDLDSLASVASEKFESDTDSDASAAEAEAQLDVDVIKEKAKSGTHIVWSCSYFSLARYQNKTDAKMIMKDKWAIPAELGIQEKSKTLQVANFDESVHGDATQTFIALKAWMLHRCQRNNWHLRNDLRVNGFRKQEADLKHECARVTLSANTEKVVTKWMPSVLL
ncbi:Uncharacterized protein SCF082_LOCUS41184 [Durusdinium trenchii]|uniref:Uncharacterized protein n=1 Tax=Durusdinium trenchii TaxID=1381693 RepID=A0ABP0QFV3_9DINO